jgi:MoaA/NifB/PqqE/SkfB family radical SAM enzyme
MPERVEPTKVRLEASSFCQLRCPSCPTTTGAIQPHVGSGFLRIDDFRRFLDANPQVRDVELSNYGEIFLNPDLLEIMRLAFERKVKLRADNGVNLNHVRPEVLEGLVRYRVRSLNCSIDGASQETYARYRVRGSFDTVIGNLRKLVDLKKRHDSKYPRLSWQFIVFGHNQHEIARAREMARELGMHFQPKLSWDDEVSPITDLDAVRRELGVDAVTRDEYRERRGVAYMHEICNQLWDRPQINWNGKLLGCCRNFWGDFGGNVFRDGLIAAVNHEKIVHAREMLQGRAPERPDLPCTTCEIYLTMKSTGHFLERKPPR